MAAKYQFYRSSRNFYHSSPKMCDISHIHCDVCRISPTKEPLKRYRFFGLLEQTLSSRKRDMTMEFKKTLLGLAAGFAIASTGAMAASQGSLATGANASSTGSSVVTLNVPNLIRISNVDDITMGYTAGSGATGTDDVCVFRNGGGNYSVQASSANGSGSFQLTDGNGSTVPYAVDWAGTTLNEGTASATLTTSETTSPSCGGTPNITLTLTATDADVASATATGAHTDTLSLMVTAE